MKNAIEHLRRFGVQPTPQRIAVAEYILSARSHPTADQVWENVRKTVPTVSRATVYNTLNLFVKRGLVRTQILREGTVVFDPHVEAHHHFIDEATGRIYDVPWDAVKVTGSADLEGFDVREYQVVLRGRKKTGRS
jgi:Fe2+ or Zn2+ uptake regulation protein